MESYDVAIIGGGPAGTTVGSMLKKYRPELEVAVFEKEMFPRDHIGESLLPTVGRILDEIDAWDDVEAAGFPIKVGATYKWGVTDDLWNFNFLDQREIDLGSIRPSKYEGWRVRSSFQVDRSKFDLILLNRCRSWRCQVFEGRAVEEIIAEGNRICALRLADGKEIKAKFFVDASGSAATIRKAMGVEIEEPPSLRNIAVWDHWENAEWAVTIGTDATRVQVTSLGYGWVWVIPISATTSSIGLVCPADYYKKSAKRPEELYFEAVRQDPRIANLIENAVPTGKVKATKDWSFVAKTMSGENWFLVGESAGFADPILAAGITMTMVGAKECAYTILELLKGKFDSEWLIESFESRQTQRVSQHIKFANFWYSANAHFTELMEFTREIARDAGLSLDAKSAWQWLGTGGFVSLETAGAGLAGHSLEQIKNLQRVMLNEESDWELTRYNVFELDLDGASVEMAPAYERGEINQVRVLRREGKSLPITGGFRLALEFLEKDSRLSGFVSRLREVATTRGPHVALACLESLEAMLKDGWVKGTRKSSLPTLSMADIPRTVNVDWDANLSS